MLLAHGTSKPPGFGVQELLLGILRIDLCVETGRRERRVAGQVATRRSSGQSRQGYIRGPEDSVPPESGGTRSERVIEDVMSMKDGFEMALALKLTFSIVTLMKLLQVFTGRDSLPVGSGVVVKVGLRFATIGEAATGILPG